MKDLFKKLKDSGLLLFVFMLLCSFFGVSDGGMLTAEAILPAGGGAVETDAMVTATETRTNSPDLLLDTIDKKVTKIRPHDVVLDTISRHTGDVKTSDNQTVRHYAIDVIDMTATLTAAYAGGDSQTALTTSNNKVFASEQTIICLGVSGYKDDHVTVDPDHDLMLYVTGHDAAKKPLVTAVNGTGADGMTIPAIALNTVLLRGGRAGSETQIQTDPYSGVPTDFTQYLQKFMAQVEMSEIFKRADKETDWEFTDAEEEAVFDMKRVQNVSYWKGKKGRIKVTNKHNKKDEDVYFTEGIWTQAGKEFDFDGTVTINKMVTFMKTSFTGNASGKKKVFIVGSDLLEKLEQVEYNRIVYVGERQKAHGLEFSSIVSKFGMLLIAHDQSLDDIGMSACGFVLDADFLRKWTMGWKVNNFDFRKSGQSDSDGRGLIEPCGLVLKNPKAHVRVYFNKVA